MHINSDNTSNAVANAAEETTGKNNMPAPIQVISSALTEPNKSATGGQPALKAMAPVIKVVSKRKLKKRKNHKGIRNYKMTGGQPVLKAMEPVIKVVSKRKLKKIKYHKEIRNYKMNTQFSRILRPKPAVTLLQELKPEVLIYSMNPPCGTYKAVVDLNGKEVAAGFGTKLHEAIDNAAEEAIKIAVTDILNNRTNHNGLNISENGRTDAMQTEENELSETPYEKLPWVSLASMALYRMFSRWKNDDNMDLSVKSEAQPEKEPQIEDIVPLTPKSCNSAENSLLPTEQILPANAHLMHPVSLLNQILQGIKTEMLESISGPNSIVTIGYRIHEQLYTGTASNAETAKTIAAARACTEVFGVNFQNH